MQKDNDRRLIQGIDSAIHTVMDASPVGMVVFNDRKRIVHANPPARDLFEVDAMEPGRLKCGDFISCVHRHEHPKGCGHTVHCADCPLFDAIRAVLTPGEASGVPAGEAHIERDPEFDSLWVTYKTVGLPLKHDHGVVMALDDITVHKKAEADQEKLQGQLLQAQRLESVGRLAGGVAHDFNNLLSVILSYAEMVLEDLQPEHPHHRMVSEVHHAGNKAKHLTRQLLAFSRKQILEMRLVDVNTVVRRFEKLLGRVIGEDVILELAIHREPLLVRADAAQLEQVLMNLTINARDAMPGGGTLTIETAVTDLDEAYAAKKPGVIPGPHALIAVSDTGSGMDAETMGQIFEPFFTTKTREKGTGLGLATCYGIVKQHEGNIWVYSEPDQGTTFKIYLPMVSRGEKREPAPPMERHTEFKGTATILVVEDDMSLMRLAGQVLRASGYRVLEANTPKIALELARNEDVSLDLVLSDVILPDMKGPEVYEKVREVHPNARVLYMSGYTQNVIARHGILKEGIQFIAKPFSASGLREKVAEVLAHP